MVRPIRAALSHYGHGWENLPIPGLESWRALFPYTQLDELLGDGEIGDVRVTEDRGLVCTTRCPTIRAWKFGGGLATIRFSLLSLSSSDTVPCVACSCAFWFFAGWEA
eukprot:scaffold8804_cov115-Isochrysis_galbana.AAC.4